MMVARQGVNLKKTGQIQHPRNTIEILFLQIEPAQEPLLDFRRGAGLQLQAHGGAAAPLAHFLLDRLEEVFHFVVVDLILAVARDAKDGGMIQLHSGKQLRQVHADNGFQRGENVAFVGRQEHKAGQHRRYGHNGEHSLVVAGPLQHHRQVQ